jgi:flagellar basal body-associated protein FliL
MLSISVKKLLKDRKVQIIAAVAVLVIVLGISIAFFVTRNNTTTAKKASTPVKTTAKTVVKATATTDDVQTDLNAINSKSSSLDTEVDGANNGLSDQPTNLSY